MTTRAMFLGGLCFDDCVVLFLVIFYDIFVGFQHGLVASVAFVGVCLLWLCHALPI